MFVAIVTALDELTGRNRHDQKTDHRDITAEVIRIA
jgi:hypothetical protein